MSGLAALFFRDGRPSEAAAVSAMLGAALYRGPDGMFIRQWEFVALGHAKLSMTPEDELEQQPLTSPRTGASIIADARLDNREEILAQLPDRDLPRTIGDADLILRAYEAWGVGSIVRLLGDFAFVIWDPREQRMICARDTSGQRGLFYRLDPRTFTAASEIQQLLQDPAVPVDPNHDRIRDFLLPRNMLNNEKDQAATFYSGIWAIPAGHVMTVSRDKVSIQKYWELEPPAELRYRRHEEYAEHFRSLFFDVIRPRLRSSYPMGALLSGGLDSSSIVCSAFELYRSGKAENRGFHSFSLVFDGLDCDERNLIQDIRTKYGFEASFLHFKGSGGRLQLEPAGFLEAPNMGIRDARDAVYRSVQESGVRALLTGDLADSCVGGTRLTFDALLRQGQLRRLWRSLQAFRRESKHSLRKTIALYCLNPFLPLAVQRRVLTLHFEHVFERVKDRLLPQWVADPLRIDLAMRHRELCLQDLRDLRFGSPGREMEYLSLYPPEVARPPAPWSLEIWRPFADRRLHRFLLAVPPDQKFMPHPESDTYYAGQKRLVRSAMRGIVPESIRSRTNKTIFSSAVQSELTTNWALYEEAFGPDAKPEVASLNYVNQARFWLRLQKLRDGKTGPDFMYAMNVVGLETWLRTFKLPRSRLVRIAPPAGAPLVISRAL